VIVENGGSGTNQMPSHFHPLANTLIRAPLAPQKPVESQLIQLCKHFP
jgi:hypothetical protein